MGVSEVLVLYIYIYIYIRKNLTLKSVWLNFFVGQKHVLRAKHKIPSVWPMISMRLSFLKPLTITF